MPVTIIECEDTGGAQMQRAYQHDCSLGEFSVMFSKLVQEEVQKRLLARTERFNWYDIFDAVDVRLGSEYLTSWQKVFLSALVPPDSAAAIRSFNISPAAFKVTNVPEAENASKPKD